MRQKSFTTEIFGKKIETQVLDTRNGLCVIIAGGDRGHIGAVSVAESGTLLMSVQLPEHREQVVSDKWAKALSLQYNVPVAVSCGVHFDDVSREQINQIVDVLDGLLEKILKEFNTSRP
ncbi:MAG: hypothetical protein ACOX75_06060 [Lachnospiraceae bacterium]|jgi:hypothetical protein